MSKSIFVNLPVKDLKASMAFFAKLGWEHNPQFTDETAASIVISDTIYAMVMTHEKFATFVNKPIADLHKTVGALLALSVETTDEMNRIVEAAVAAGGREAREKQDYGFMQARTFEDLDGQIWEIVWMNMDAMPQ
jgi:predicted lactoylglutathione lyase